VQTGFKDADRDQFVAIIRSNVVVSIRTLAQKAEEFGNHVEATEEAEAVKALVDDAVLDAGLGEKIARLWADEGIQDTYAVRARFQLNDSAKYFLDKVEKISEPGYKPSEDDVLRARVRTSGIVRSQFVIRNVPFECYDVGGQRSERRKWIHCFDNVDAVIFVAAISEYDQVLYEDETVSRIDEAVTLWEEVYNSRFFASSSMVLFLNKRDLFEDKLHKVDIRFEGDDFHPPRFLDYDGGKLADDMDKETYDATLENAQRYMVNLFEACVDADRRPVYVHLTTAIDKRNVETVFTAAKDSILRSNVEGSGFME
jgi:GTPase SAR1 family protein